TNFREIGRILRDEQNSTNNYRFISMVYKIRPTPYENHTLNGSLHKLIFLLVSKDSIRHVNIFYVVLA
ncbi:MAG: hypothetical protein OXC62_12610, partial [Aestuariivita sp.]|nr:hypothetical protein [Aestuariivita sp.]